MGNLDHTDVPECDALPRTATVVAVNQYTLDVQIGETVYEKVPVHYHCDDPWKEHSHPHSTAEQEQMLSAFEEDDEVLVLCDDDGDPVCVTGFKEEPKQCRGCFIFPTLTKIGATNKYDENGDPATPNQSAEGAFIGLLIGGGQGSTAHGFWRATFNTAGSFTLYVNDIEMPGNYWDTDEHLSLTGAPTTWKLEGYDWFLVMVTVTQQGYDEYEVDYPTVEFGFHVTNDCPVSGGGSCAGGGGGTVDGHSTRRYFTGRITFPLRGAAAPWQTVITSTLYTLFGLYPYGKEFTKVDYDYVHHGYEEDETCHVANPPPYLPYIHQISGVMGLFLYHKWAAGKIGLGRARTDIILPQFSGGGTTCNVFTFGAGYRIDLTSDLLECWDCQQEIDTTVYYVGDDLYEGDPLWTQPYSRVLWQLKYQIEDSYLEELFNEHDLDLLAGDIEVDMTLPEELFGVM